MPIEEIIFLFSQGNGLEWEISLGLN